MPFFSHLLLFLYSLLERERLCVCERDPISLHALFVNVNYTIWWWLDICALGLKNEKMKIKFEKYLGFLGDSDVKESACSARDLGLIPGLGRSPGGGNGYPFQYSCLENSTDRQAWRTWGPWSRKKLDMTERLAISRSSLKSWKGFISALLLPPTILSSKLCFSSGTKI